MRLLIHHQHIERLTGNRFYREMAFSKQNKLDSNSPALLTHTKAEPKRKNFLFLGKLGDTVGKDRTTKQYTQ